jgi:CHAT domain-containing protein
LIHYAGHAFFDENKPERSGILCHGEGMSVLSGDDLAGLGNLPTLVFFNACEAGRLRSGGNKRPSAQQIAESRVAELPKGISFAEAFMRGGVANFLATYWPVGDQAAKVFAETFYVRLMKGSAIGEAVQEGREAVKQTGSKDWADYLFYGDAEFVLKTAASGGGLPSTPAATKGTPK